MSKKKLYRILIEGIVCAVLIFILVFFVGFRVTKVEVKGNEFYSDKEIKRMVLDAPIAKNTILAMMIKTGEKTKDAQLIEKVTLKRKGMNTLVVQVKEKKLIGYLIMKGNMPILTGRELFRFLQKRLLKMFHTLKGSV